MIASISHPSPLRAWRRKLCLQSPRQVAIVCGTTICMNSKYLLERFTSDHAFGRTATILQVYPIGAEQLNSLHVSLGTLSMVSRSCRLSTWTGPGPSAWTLLKSCVDTFLRRRVALNTCNQLWSKQSMHAWREAFTVGPWAWLGIIVTSLHGTALQLLF
jgi:hypothetical protein